MVPERDEIADGIAGARSEARLRTSWAAASAGAEHAPASSWRARARANRRRLAFLRAMPGPRKTISVGARMPPVKPSAAAVAARLGGVESCRPRIGVSASRVWARPEAAASSAAPTMTITGSRDQAVARASRDAAADGGPDACCERIAYRLLRRDPRPEQMNREEAHDGGHEGDRDTEADEHDHRHRRPERLDEADAREAQRREAGGDDDPGGEDDRQHLRRRVPRRRRRRPRRV